jgi:hypothetical protein
VLKGTHAGTGPTELSGSFSRKATERPFSIRDRTRWPDGHDNRPHPGTRPLYGVLCEKGIGCTTDGFGFDY